MPIFRQVVALMTHFWFVFSVVHAFVFSASLFHARHLADQSSLPPLKSYSITKVLTGRSSNQPRFQLRLELEAPLTSNRPLMLLFEDRSVAEMLYVTQSRYALDTAFEFDSKSTLRFYVQGGNDTLRLEPPLTITSELRK